MFKTNSLNLSYLIFPSCKFYGCNIVNAILKKVNFLSQNNFLLISILFIILGVPDFLFAQSVFPDELLDSGPKRSVPPAKPPEKKKENGTSSTSSTNSNQKKDKKERTSPYIKMKFQRDGSEIEMYVDPAYSDVNLDVEFKHSTATIEATGKPEETMEDRIKKMLDSYMKPKSEEESAGKEGDKKSKKGQPSSVQPSEEEMQPDAVTSKALGHIYKAQRLFYARNYNQALNEIQSSLDTKETAWAYALQGSLYYSMGQRQSALNAYRSALTLDPSMREVRNLLRTLESRMTLPTEPSVEPTELGQ